MALSPDGRPTGQISQAAQAAAGLPQGFQRASPFPFSGVNQTDDRTALADQEFFWLENLLKIGQGKLRALGDVGPALFNVPGGRLIVAFAFFNIGAVDYAIVFLDNGTAKQVRVSDGAVTTIPVPPNTFYVPTGPLPATCGSGGRYLLISNNNTANDYWIWDGAVLYLSGTIAPMITITDPGSGYTSTPTITFYGGSGVGLAGIAQISNGAVTGVQITNPGTGFSPGDVVQLQFSGGGTDTGAILEAVLAASSISEIILLNGGTGYTDTPTVNIIGGGGTGAVATAVLTGGVVTSVIIDAPGTGYTSTPTITFSQISPPTSGAIARATVTSASVAAVNIVNGGTNFTGTPLLTIIGGGGSGATATATITSGAISGVTITNGGSGYTSTPAVEVSAGLNNAAQATAELMPFGISGTYIETFQSRVWILHPHQGGTMPSGGIFNVSAPGSLTDFATSDGGEEFTSTDRYLRKRFTFMRQANGYLYAAGDSSVSVISNVQTSGNPPTTTFTYQNADPQVGSNYQNSVIDFGRTILFANQIGVYGIFGGSVVKVSGKLDRVFQNGVFPGNAGGTPCVTPSAAAAIVYDTKVSVLLITISDPFTGLPRTVQLLWNEKEWTIASSEKNLIFISGLESDSNLTAYGTDGLAIWPLYGTPSPTLPKVIASKYWGTERCELLKEAQRWWVVGRDMSTEQAGASLFWVTDFAASQAEDRPGEGSIPSPNGAVLLGGAGTGLGLTGGMTDDVVAPLLGFKVTSVSPDFEITNATMGYIAPVGSVYG